MNKQTREAVQALLSQVEDLLELDYWYGSGDDEYQAQEEASAKQATRLVRRYLLEVSAKKDALEFVNEKDREARKGGQYISNKPELIRLYVTEVLSDFDKADN